MLSYNNEGQKIIGFGFREKEGMKVFFVIFEDALRFNEGGRGGESIFMF